MDKYLPTISFRLINSELLESGYVSSMTFSQDGGQIGSSPQCEWQIQDSHNSVAPVQCSILWKDKHFCLKASTESVYVNNAVVPSYLDAVRLAHGDQIKLGQLKLSVNISLTGQPKEDLMAVTPQSLVSSNSNPLDSLFDTTPTQSHEPIHYELAPTVQGSLTYDPLQALENESLSLISQTKQQSADPLLMNGTHFAQFSANPSSDNQGNTMVQEFMDLPKITPTLDDSITDIEHVAVNPLMQGLGIHLNLQTSQQANDFLVELGKTVRSAIEGLLALQQQQESLQDKQLRPIEDNPLRLNSSYQETMALMFTDARSPVHLSAPSAVAESLHNMQLHYQANQAAISTALSTMLAAFSPEHLLNRFAHYRRASDNTSTDDAWAWEMYNNYYKELSSSRQQGFEKLFYEVYTHAYDRALRKGLEEA
ncbi:type VI secretion system-associated FHA domain protein TagH [Providencia stuartii]|uniref:type VI secretion system-associated FHA domain protein TagH n=1 Tax=Providencia TaxID=586 RepID=UPI0024B1D8A2|nr:type VI secretion system-associated FHA domain protein TagH [Providencia sp. 2023EL-00965]ELR5300012.1 type VI secretion system-associated FHA domain protein TagH [Providencia stuartii]MDW7588973.1 type VI secretion system-associated FHA domain protein TagH [Providencia sp. 2023EL-00965]